VNGTTGAAGPAPVSPQGAARVDVALSPTGDVDQRQAAQDAELSGYDGLWVGEITHDPFLMLSLAATATRRLELGTSVALALARSPMALAVTANDLQALCGGRFRLGLGSQVRAHITRRFGMPWTRPAARMREFVLALRAIWDCWAGTGDQGQRLDFQGEFYRLSLMPPQFVPRPHQFGPPPVLLAAVGSAMTETAAEVADGLLCHGFTTARYLEEVTLPALRRGRGGCLDGFDVVGHPMIVTGRSEADLRRAQAAVRAQVAFYASTPAYRPVLDLHGWGELGEGLHRLSRLGRWPEMSALVDDTVLAAFAVIGEPRAVAAELGSRYGKLFTRCVLHTPYELHPDVLAEIADGVRCGAGSRDAPAAGAGS
jgi:probable F420-dependent oxidoreductase